jgi:electron-transferring-flavoprotein dehydrogenase
MKSGMLAAETIFEGLRAGEVDGRAPRPLRGRVEASWIRDELWPVRNFHQAFDHGLFAGMLQAASGMVTGGRGWGLKDRLPPSPATSGWSP